MKKVIAIVLLQSVVWSSAGMAQPDLSVNKGTWLYERYQGYKKDNNLDWGIFTGYIAGVADAEVADATTAGKNAPWCRPEGAVMSQYFDIVGRYLETHPERRQAHRVQLTIEALAEAWPCRATRK